MKPTLMRHKLTGDIAIVEGDETSCDIIYLTDGSGKLIHDISASSDSFDEWEPFTGAVRIESDGVQVLS